MTIKQWGEVKITESEVVASGFVIDAEGDDESTVNEAIRLWAITRLGEVMGNVMSNKLRAVDKLISFLRGMIEGPGGETSSKRVSGVTMIGLGTLMLVALGVYGFFAVPPGLEAIKYAGLSLIASGAALLGIGTLAERLGK